MLNGILGFAPLLWFTGHFRFRPILSIVRLVRNLPGGIVLVGIFDPNIIRKEIDLTFSPKQVMLKAYGGTFLVDVNEHLGYQFFMARGFDPLVLQIATFLEIDENSILLDIGANIGSTSVPFAMQYGAEIIAVEASKQNAQLLLRNAFLNGVKIQPNIICAVDQSTADASPWLEFFVKSGNSAANSMFDEWNPSKSKSKKEYVKTSTIDKVLENTDQSRIKLIKIDVEGSELSVLKGFTKLPSIGAPLLFEYRVDVMKRDLGDDGVELIQLIRENFDIFGIIERDSGIALCEFDEAKPYANALAIPKSKKDYYLKRLPLT